MSAATLVRVSAAAAAGFCAYASADTTADAVLGQPNFTSMVANYPAGTPSASNLALSNAAHVAIGPDGRLYVSDADNSRVLSWPSATSFMTGAAADLVIGQPDFASNDFNNGGISAHSLALPQGLCVDETGDLWIADAFNCRVLRYDNPAFFDAEADQVIGQPDFISNEMNMGGGQTAPDVARRDSLLFPGRVVVRAGNVFVADSGNSRVLLYQDPQANTPLADKVWGQYGSFTCRAKNNDGACHDFGPPTAETLYNPIGIALDAAGRLWVADWNNHRVLWFDDAIAGDTVADGVLGQADFSGSIANAGGSPGPATFNLPIDLTFAGGGELLVADAANNRVLAFRRPALPGAAASIVFGQLGGFSGGAPNHGLGFFETDADGLFGPTGLALDRAGNLIVADTNNQRVLRFNTPLRFPRPTGPNGPLSPLSIRAYVP
ncbi:MAG: NHL repeat-containing protein [Phycisphaerales bacterium]|nr:NHL repeat-containing protein [Phycisphaerales bacterium]